jgi:hypothetical protein
MSEDTFNDLFPAFPRIDHEWKARKQRLMALTAAQRVAAMRAGELSYRELAYWSAVRPDEVPRISTGTGILGGEFEWIAASMPEFAEAIEPMNPANHRRHGTGRDR